MSKKEDAVSQGYVVDEAVSSINLECDNSELYEKHCYVHMRNGERTYFYSVDELQDFIYRTYCNPMVELKLSFAAWTELNCLLSDEDVEFQELWSFAEEKLMNSEMMKLGAFEIETEAQDEFRECAVLGTTHIEYFTPSSVTPVSNITVGEVIVMTGKSKWNMPYIEELIKKSDEKSRLDNE